MNENMYAQEAMPQSTPSQITLQQVIDALMKGIEPEELLEAGVPQAMVEKAMQVIMQEQQVSQEQSGLAGAVMREDDGTSPQSLPVGIR